MNYIVNIGTLNSYNSNLKSAKGNFKSNSYGTFSSSYVSSCSDNPVPKMKSNLDKIYKEIDRAYNSMEEWFSSYISDAEGTENSLASGNAGGVSEGSISSCLNGLPQLERTFKFDSAFSNINQTSSYSSAFTNNSAVGKTGANSSDSVSSAIEADIRRGEKLTNYHKNQLANAQRIKQEKAQESIAADEARGRRATDYYQNQLANSQRIKQEKASETIAADEARGRRATDYYQNQLNNATKIDESKKVEAVDAMIARGAKSTYVAGATLAGSKKISQEKASETIAADEARGRKLTESYQNRLDNAKLINQQKASETIAADEARGRKLTENYQNLLNRTSDINKQSATDVVSAAEKRGTEGTSIGDLKRADYTKINAEKIIAADEARGQKLTEYYKGIDAKATANRTDAGISGSSLRAEQVKDASNFKDTQVERFVTTKEKERIDLMEKGSSLRAEQVKDSMYNSEKPSPELVSEYDMRQLDTFAGNKNISPYFAGSSTTINTRYGDVQVFPINDSRIIGNNKSIPIPSGDQLEYVYAVIRAEGGGKSVEEARAIADVLVNRSRAGNWGGGDQIYTNAIADDQFAVTWDGSAQAVLDGTSDRAELTPEMIQAINEEFVKGATGQDTAYPYQSFRAHGSGYSNITISPGGNEFGY